MEGQATLVQSRGRIVTPVVVHVLSKLPLFLKPAQYEAFETPIHTILYGLITLSNLVALGKISTDVSK